MADAAVPPPPRRRAANAPVPAAPDDEAAREVRFVESLFADPRSLAAAIVVGEILAPPVSLRKNS